MRKPKLLVDEVIDGITRQPADSRHTILRM